MAKIKKLTVKKVGKVLPPSKARRGMGAAMATMPKMTKGVKIKSVKIMKKKGY